MKVCSYLRHWRLRTRCHHCICLYLDHLWLKIWLYILRYSYSFYDSVPHTDVAERFRLFWRGNCTLMQQVVLLEDDRLHCSFINKNSCYIIFKWINNLTTANRRFLFLKKSKTIWQSGVSNLSALNYLMFCPFAFKMGLI